MFMLSIVTSPYSSNYLKPFAQRYKMYQKPRPKMNTLIFEKTENRRDCFDLGMH